MFFQKQDDRKGCCTWYCKVWVKKCPEKIFRGAAVPQYQGIKKEEPQECSSSFLLWFIGRIPENPTPAVNDSAGAETQTHYL